MDDTEFRLDSGPGLDGGRFVVTDDERQLDVATRREMLAAAVTHAHLDGRSPDELAALERELSASLGLTGGGS